MATAVITGGTRGIGFEIAMAFAEAGYSLLITYRGNDDAANRAKAELEKLGVDIIVEKSDISNFENAKETIEKAKEKFGSVDVLVNNAGITNDKLIMRMSPEDFNEVVDTNLGGAFNMLKAVTPIMMKQRAGSVVNLSSIVGLRGNAGQVNYSASKAGLIGLTLSAAKELGSRGITVNAIAPGFIETEMTAVLTEKQKEGMLESIALRRAGTPKDVAETALFLARSKYITAQVIGVDGGMSI